MRNDIWSSEKTKCDVFNSMLYLSTSQWMVAFTGCAALRDPQELGGAFYTFTLGSTLVVGLLSAVLYEKDESSDGMDESTAVIVMTTACTGMLISYVTLLLSMDRKFVRTFFWTKTGNQQIQEIFTKSSKDKWKIRVFKYNKRKWKRTIGDEVKTWLNSRLPVWFEEKPDWLTVDVKCTIPDELVENKAMFDTLNSAEVVQRKKENRRRSSVSMRMSGRGR